MLLFTVIEVNPLPVHYPHKDYVSNCGAYWLASFGVKFESYVLSVLSTGYVDPINYSDNSKGIRPIVFIPSNIQFKLVDGV